MKNLYKIHFRTGLTINVIAESLEFTVSNLSGEVIGYKFSGISGEYPRFMQMSDIIAITQKEVED